MPYVPNKPKYLPPDISYTQYITFLGHIRESNDFDLALARSKISRRNILRLLAIPEVLQEIETNRRLWHYRMISRAEREMMKRIEKEGDVQAIKFLLSSLHPAYRVRRAGSGPGVGGTLGAQFVCDQGQSEEKKSKEDT